MRWFRKRFWVWAIGVLVVLGVVWSLPPVRTEYHKWGLQTLKAKKDRYMAGRLTSSDKFWMKVVGEPQSTGELEGKMRKHEDALVRLGFLQREEFVAEAGLVRGQLREASEKLGGGCPWQHVETMADSNVVVTACGYGMEIWRKRAQEFGWSQARRLKAKG